MPHQIEFIARPGVRVRFENASRELPPLYERGDVLLVIEHESQGELIAISAPLSPARQRFVSRFLDARIKEAEERAAT